MKLYSRDQIESLSKFQSENFLTTSFYLDTDKSRLTKKEIVLSARNLIRNGKSRSDALDINKAKKGSINEDLDKIRKFCSQNFNSFKFPGLAIFSCSRQEFWQVFSLPHSPRNRLIFDKDPYVRLLSSILDEYHNIFVLTLDRREAKWYDTTMGNISLLDTMVGDVPSKVREGGWEGYESKRIERHIATHLRDFFKSAAKKTFELFKKNHFDWIFIGCREEHCSEFEPLLHPYLKKRLKGRIKASPGDSAAKVLRASQVLEKKLQKQEEDTLITLFISELERGGRAISGLKNTLKRLNRGEVQTLLVTRNFTQPGRYCPKCQFIYKDELHCLSCRRKTNPAMDIIDEAVEAAWEKNGQVKHITPPSRLNRYGKIGAFLRY